MQKLSRSVRRLCSVSIYAAPLILRPPPCDLRFPSAPLPGLISFCSVRRSDLPSLYPALLNRLPPVNALYFLLSSSLQTRRPSPPAHRSYFLYLYLDHFSHLVLLQAALLLSLYFPNHTLRSALSARLPASELFLAAIKFHSEVFPFLLLLLFFLRPPPRPQLGSRPLCRTLLPLPVQTPPHAVSQGQSHALGGHGSPPTTSPADLQVTSLRDP